MKYYSCVVACWALLAVVGRATPAKIEGLEQTQEIDDVNDRDPELPRTCELSTDINETSFQNPGYPSATSIPTDACRHKVYPVNDYICQIRLDLKDFILAQPDWDGVCATDFMQVSGAMTKIPQICGINSGQHLYLEVTPDFGSVTINVDTSAPGAKWSISVAQIECNSPYRAPAGCLQYFTSTHGTIKSFNYDATTFNSPNTPPTATTQLASQAYGVCIKPQSGFCSVAYTKTSGVSDDYSFSLSGDASVLPIGAIGSVGSTDCTTDYLMIPMGTITDTTYPATSADRYCGVNFPSKVESLVQPFVFYVVTDETETNHADPALDDGPNVGFSIGYRMQAC
ncbi:uncharacterized protein LOC108672679 [Hyalella azteca]|uniref:Uncharacterized protein LOC108672679 n=1 Tax=Hyalella azteca TaxID=294128 RepID=A0A8B7NQB3_HYAAZ|nr:uncharacterized protein LOC108672679 [Hyalella azteca]